MRVEFHIIARAVVVADSRVLLARTLGAAHTFLPGGHVKPGEPVRAALERELAEELGAPARAKTYLGAVEASWVEGAVRHHEVNHIFQTEMPILSPDRPPSPSEPHLEFLWSSSDDLDRHNLLPAPLRDLLRRWIGGDRSAWWAGE